jgi:hypothetical protein
MVRRSVANSTSFEVGPYSSFARRATYVITMAIRVITMAIRMITMAIYAITMRRSARSRWREIRNHARRSGQRGRGRRVGPAR